MGGRKGYEITKFSMTIHLFYSHIHTFAMPHIRIFSLSYEYLS